MARSPIYIPEEVKAKIREHLAERYPQALDGFASASEEEDALTGDMGASFRARNRKVMTIDQKENKGEWIWSMTYKKVRGRGPHATENIIGADGIFELTVQNGDYIERKSLLFQAKIDWRNDPNILEQAIKLSNWREAAFMLNFKPDRIEAISLDATVRSRGRMPADIVSKRVDEYIGQDFLNCDVGDQDLYYDLDKRVLRWQTMNGDIVSAPFSIKHHLGIKIASPNVKAFYGRIIDRDEIFNNRMNASPEQVLSLPSSPTDRDIRKAQALMARTYHTDTLSFNDPLMERLANNRMQDANHAADLLKQKNQGS